MIRRTSYLLAALVLAACASDQAGKAAVTPLNDLNVVHAEIPSVLQTAQKAPYAAPADKGCAALKLDVQELDAALGADLDAPPTERGSSLIERGGNEVLKSAAESVIPFRGWVRKLSGAERYSREVAAAIAAGTVRRSYLKGLAQAAGCAAPPAPRSP